MAPTCTICLESEPPPIQSGCACRSDAGLAHVACRVRAAASKSTVNDGWHRCSTCTQAFTGEMQRQLSGALTARVQALPAGDGHARPFAMRLEVMAQLDGWQYAAAERTARILHETLRTMRGDEHESTLGAAGLVATTLAKQGKYEEAARIQRAVLGASKRGATVTDTGNRASALSQQGKHADAERLFIEAVETSARVHGAEHLCTLTLRCERRRNRRRGPSLRSRSSRPSRGRSSCATSARAK
jgi:hypothetical protein